MKLTKFVVNPDIPEVLKPLEELAHNLWFSWDFETIQLFIRLDFNAWMESNQSPVRMLGIVPQETLEEASSDDSYLAALQDVYKKFKDYREAETWYDGEYEDFIAYFSMEYGLDVSLPIYSGGLGILSGDHMKTTSDLGLPLVGVGLLYRQGYFVQYLNRDGFQQESYPENDWYKMPVTQCLDKDGNNVKISVTIGGSVVIAQVWETKIGRTSLYLLDTNINENTPENRTITSCLYGGDREHRIKQEMLLGIGGIRALRAIGIRIAVTHMNEGHSAFLILERVRELIESKQLNFAEARELIRTTNIFTTHTPVPAGNERYSLDLMQKYLKPFVGELGVGWGEFLSMGRERPNDPNETFCMTVFALKFSFYSNGVSKLHGDVSRDMWKNIWPNVPRNEVPIESITNGVHIRTWLSHDMRHLLDRYLGPDFYYEPLNTDVWDRIDRISDAELWRAHEIRQERLVVFTRRRAREQMKRKGASTTELAQAEDLLSPYALTISFARRFATYKRAALLFRDPDRLIKLLNDPKRPIQLIFSGKAHPHDLPGKELIKEIVHFSERPEVRNKIIFLENYDMATAKYLVSGSTLWLNNPRRPLEASGTSGMKAAINGVLNFSVLDGWWAEGYSPDIGWSIGQGEEYEDEELQNEVESKAIYDMLEREIIPAFYERGRDGLPRRWIAMMKESIKQVGKTFSSHRMLADYAKKFYFPALKNYRTYTADECRKPRDLAAYMDKLNFNWQKISVKKVESDIRPVLKVNDTIKVRAEVVLASLAPEEVAVQIYIGHVDSTGELSDTSSQDMRFTEKKSDKAYYECELPLDTTGQLGYAIRLVPRHPDLVHEYVPGFLKWAE